MSINSIIIDTLSPICPNIQANIYEGAETEYLTFKYDILPANFADDDANSLVYLIMIHYCCSNDTNSLEKRKSIRQALSRICTYPTENNLSDENGQEYVYTCEYTDGDL